MEIKIDTQARFPYSPPHKKEGKTTLDRALAVAESAGGFLGLTSKVSASERAVIEELENVLRVS